MDDSFLSRPGPSRPARQPIGLGIDAGIPSTSLPDPADIYHSHSHFHSLRMPPGRSTSGGRSRSPPVLDLSFGSDAAGTVGVHGHVAGMVQDDSGEGGERDESGFLGVQGEDGEMDGDDAEAEAEDEAEGEGEAEGDEEDAASETSSAMYDPQVDPEGFARRLNELAGMMEMSEEETRAMRQGPIVGKGHKPPLLPLADFKSYISHYLSSTEWRYAPPSHVDPVFDRQGVPELYHPDKDYGSLHPIRVFGKSWVGQEVTQGMLEDLVLDDGLPRMRHAERAVEGLIR